MDLNEHQVRERAYLSWERDGRPAGRADHYWLQAQAELAGNPTTGAKPGKAKAKAAPKAAKATAKAKKGTTAAEAIALH